MSEQPCPVFLINLDRDTDRLEHMRGVLEQAGLAFERVPAVLGLDMPDWVKPYFLNADGGIASALRVGEVGCYASHLVVARRMVDQEIPFALVFEDDLQLCDGFCHLITKAIGKLPAKWDILRLSNPPKAAYVPLAGLTDGHELALYSRVPNNTGASLLSLSGARKLLRAEVRTLQIDEHLRRPWMLGLETYGIVPAPVHSNIFEASSIDRMGARGLGRESAFAKLARRKFESPAAMLGQIRWQIARLGLSGWLRCITRTLRVSLCRKLAGREKGAGNACAGLRLVRFGE